MCLNPKIVGFVIVFRKEILFSSKIVLIWALFSNLMHIYETPRQVCILGVMVLRWSLRPLGILLFFQKFRTRTDNIDMECPTLYGKDNVSKQNKKKIILSFWIILRDIVYFWKRWFLLIRGNSFVNK